MTFLAAAMRDAAVTVDDRGLMPLDEARALVAATDRYVKGEHIEHEGKTMLESDRVWAAILSLADAAEAVRESTRIEWDFQVRAHDNLALLERYGDGILPWLRSRLVEHTLINVPWCVVPCILALDHPGALDVALASWAVEGRLSEEREQGDAPEPDLSLALDWASRNPGVRVPHVARAAALGDEAAGELLTALGGKLGGLVLEAITPALGEEQAAALAARFELPATTPLSPEIRAILDEAEVMDEPRGPLWGIAELDAAAASYDLPLWDNANYSTGAMRVTGFASRHGDVLAIQSVRTFPGANEACVREITCYGPGRAKPGRDLLVPPADLENTWLTSSTAYVSGVTNELHIWGEHDETGTRDDESEGWRIIPQPMPAEQLILSLAGSDVSFDFHLPVPPPALAEKYADDLRAISPIEGVLINLCSNHRDKVLLDAEALGQKIGVAEGAHVIFEVDDFQHVVAGEAASESPDWVCLVEALRARRKVRRLPGRSMSKPVAWAIVNAEMRSYDGEDAWAPGDGPFATPPPGPGLGATPYLDRLLGLGWPHGVQLLHAPAYHQAGAARATVDHLLGAGRPAMRVFWPRGTACLWLRALCGAERREGMLFRREAAALVDRFVVGEGAAPWAAGDVPLLLEALIGGDATVQAFATALAAHPEALASDRAPLADAIHELGYLLRRAPDREAVTATLEGLPAGDGQVGRALALVLGGREAAERLAREDSDLAHVPPSEREWLRGELGALAAGEPDAALVVLAGPELLDRWRERAATVADPVWVATQAAMFADARATAVIEALAAAHPALAGDILAHRRPA